MVFVGKDVTPADAAGELRWLAVELSLIALEAETTRRVVG